MSIIQNDVSKFRMKTQEIVRFFELYSVFYGVDIADIADIQNEWDRDHVHVHDHDHDHVHDHDHDHDHDDPTLHSPDDDCECDMTHEEKKCSYIFTKGPRKNRQCDDNVVGKCYCQQHTECEKTGQKRKKGLVTPTNNKTRGVIIKNKPAPREPPKNIPMYIVKHRSKDFYWHPESHFVFDKKTRHVTGIYSENELHILNEQDTKICKSYGFKVTSS